MIHHQNLILNGGYHYVNVHIIVGNEENVVNKQRLVKVHKVRLDLISLLLQQLQQLVALKDPCQHRKQQQEQRERLQRNRNQCHHQANQLLQKEKANVKNCLIDITF